MNFRFSAAAASAALFCCHPAFAQEAPAAVQPPPAETPAAPAPCCTAPAGTFVDIEIVSLLSSKTAKRGDKFEILLAEPVVVDGRVVLPAGIPGVGEVVHAADSHIGGKPGELLLAARYLQDGDTRIALKGMKLGVSGQDNSALALAASFVVPLAFLAPGGEVKVVSGTRAHAKLTLPLTRVPSAEPTPAETQVQSEETQK